MPAKDRYHDAVRRALVKDGWVIEAEQVRLTYGDRYLWIDLRAKTASDQNVILIEVKELDEVASPVEAFASAVGKYLIYRTGLAYIGQAIPLYLAVTEAAYAGILSSVLGQEVREQFQILLLVFNPEREEIVRWTP